MKDFADTKEVARAIDRNFTSPNVADSNLEAANLVDVFDNLVRALWRIAALYECELRQRYAIPADLSNKELRDLEPIRTQEIK